MSTDTQDSVATGRRARALRWSAYAAVPLAALVIVYFATRGAGAGSQAGASAKDGATSTASGAAASVAPPVMISAADARRIGVPFAVASVVPLGREIRTVGQVTFDETRVRTVSLKIDGWVEQLFVNFDGQAVVAGAPLFAIYSPMLVAAQEELLLAKRLESDVSGGAADARANATSLLSSARRRLSYWDIPPADIARIERSGQVQRTLIMRSLVSGFVVEKNVQQGQRVMAGEPLYRIADLSLVWVEGEVFERDLSSVRLGQIVTVQVDALAGRDLTGRITYLYPTLNAETRTLRIRVALVNPGQRLKPGMYATLVWTGAGVVSGLSVPRSAVVSTGQRNLVFVKKPDGMLEPRLVDVGSSTDDRVEIRRGLSPGDTVVASATFLIDAESNLGSALGGMGNMPGMDIGAPKAASKVVPKAAARLEMPGMDMPAPKKPE